MTPDAHLRSLIAANWRACPDPETLAAAVEVMAAARETAGYRRVELHHKLTSAGARAWLDDPAAYPM